MNAWRMAAVWVNGWHATHCAITTLPDAHLWGHATTVCPVVWPIQLPFVAVAWIEHFIFWACCPQ
jgi:hypothetical protein